MKTSKPATEMSKTREKIYRCIFFFLSTKIEFFQFYPQERSNCSFMLFPALSCLLMSLTRFSSENIKTSNRNEQDKRHDLHEFFDYFHPKLHLHVLLNFVLTNDPNVNIMLFPDLSCLLMSLTRFSSQNIETSRSNDPKSELASRVIFSLFFHFSSGVLPSVRWKQLFPNVFQSDCDCCLYNRVKHLKLTSFKRFSSQPHFDIFPFWNHLNFFDMKWDELCNCCSMLSYLVTIVSLFPSENIKTSNRNEQETWFTWFFRLFSSKIASSRLAQFCPH